LGFCTPYYRIPFEDELNIQCLKNCKQLTHLEIKTLKINDNLFTEIDSIVPQLKVFKITTNEDNSYCIGINFKAQELKSDLF
jgi:hypothetical protein